MIFNRNGSDTQQEIDSTGLSVATVGRLISGFGQQETSLYCEPTVNLDDIVRTCQVTFRPLPKGFADEKIISIRDRLQKALLDNGVQVLPWEEALTDFRQFGFIPILNRRVHYRTRAVKSTIHAVIDVEQPNTWVRRLRIGLVEFLYRIGTFFSSSSDTHSIPTIARLSMWGEDHAVFRLQDYSKTQVVTLAQVEPALVQPDLYYRERVTFGLNILSRTFSPIVIGICSDRLAMINLNQTDTTVEISQLKSFVRNCLIPKLFIPITPMLPGQFSVGHYDPSTCDSSRTLVQLSCALKQSDLLPDGHAISNIIRRRSRRDMARAISAGRTGVSFGFIACAQPPEYVEPRQITQEQWKQCEAIPVYPENELRRHSNGRFYAKIHNRESVVFRQIPNLSIASSRSGSDKTNLKLTQDILRIRYDGLLFRIEIPDRVENTRDINPSYDIRVMVAQVLACALYAPERMANGLALFHFHGYPHRDWFGAKEYFTGHQNPSVPCGTLEAGALNFRAVAELVNRHGPDFNLICIVEPDHGTNLMGPNVSYLIKRVNEGVQRDHLSLGNRYFSTLYS